MNDDLRNSLVRRAIAAAQHAYIPYSNYAVGAALLASDGTVYGGCNVENAAYHPTICAERTALVKAISEGQRTFEAIAVVTRDGGSPCGTCRQMLHEFAPDMLVIVANLQGDIKYEMTVDELLPNCFTPKSLDA